MPSGTGPEPPINQLLAKISIMGAFNSCELILLIYFLANVSEAIPAIAKSSPSMSLL
jgi:hypothetical protein